MNEQKHLLERGEQLETFVKLVVEIHDKDYNSKIEYNIARKFILKMIRERDSEVTN